MAAFCHVKKGGSRMETKEQNVEDMDVIKQLMLIFKAGGKVEYKKSACRERKICLWQCLPIRVSRPMGMVNIF